VLGRQQITGPGERPYSVICNHKELVPRERRGELIEPIMRHRDLKILVGTTLIAEKEVECPAASDVSRRADFGQQGGDVLRPPGVPRL
jgi:hypothetical protein